jgi:hypothetical protein
MGCGAEGHDTVHHYTVHHYTVHHYTVHTLPGNCAQWMCVPVRLQPRITKIQMECQICSRLFSRQERMDALHIEAFRRLNAIAGMPDPQEFSKGAARVMEAKRDSDVARLELEQHRRVHSGAT